MNLTETADGHTYGVDSKRKCQGPKRAQTIRGSRNHFQITKSEKSSDGSCHRVTPKGISKGSSRTLIEMAESMESRLDS